MNRFSSSAALLLVLGLSATAWGWPPGYTGDRSTTILPAHMTTTAFKMSARGGAVARNYHEIQLRHGHEKAEAFAQLHPFVQNTYGTKVPIIGISQGPGGAGSASGGAMSDAKLSAALEGKGPMPADAQAVLEAARKQQQIARLRAELAALEKK
jgi:hypothetical protein